MPVSKVGILGFSYICRPTHTFGPTLLSAHHGHPDCKSRFISATSDNHKYCTGGKGQPYISWQLSIHPSNCEITGFSVPDRASKMSHDWENTPELKETIITEPVSCINSSCVHYRTKECSWKVSLPPCLKMLTGHDPDLV